MPLSAALADNVPVWLFTGALLISGWVYDKSSEHTREAAHKFEKHSNSIEGLRESMANKAEDIAEIKAGIIRIENILIEEGARKYGERE